MGGFLSAPANQTQGLSGEQRARSEAMLRNYEAYRKALMPYIQAGMSTGMTTPQDRVNARYGPGTWEAFQRMGFEGEQLGRSAEDYESLAGAMKVLLQVLTAGPEDLVKLVQGITEKPYTPNVPPLEHKKDR